MKCQKRPIQTIYATYNERRKDGIGDENQVGLRQKCDEVEDHPDGIDGLRLYDGLHHSPGPSAVHILGEVSPGSSVMPVQTAEQQGCKKAATSEQCALEGQLYQGGAPIALTCRAKVRQDGHQEIRN